MTDAALASALATEAGEFLLRLRAAGELSPEELRTRGDAGAQEVLARRLAEEAPADAVLSEEAKDSAARLSASRVWIIDPLDGTREYGEGRADWAVHVALWVDGDLAAGAVAIPAEGITLDTANPLPRPRPADRIRLAVSRSRPPAFVTALAERLDAELVPMGSAGVKATAVLRGQVDAYVHAGGQYEWDSAAPVAVARAAGPAHQPDRRQPARLQPARPAAARPGRRPARGRGPGPDRCFVRRARRGVRPMTDPTRYQLSQLQTLEAEAIHIMREVAAEFERPVLLFSGGKDSIVMLRLAEKAFYPAKIPFPVMHVDTGHNFPEVLAYRDRRVKELGIQLIVASVQDAIERGFVRELPDGTRNRIQTPVLLDALEKHRFTAVFGGARRDEDKARAKERIYSFRDEFGQWDPKNQRPELWNIYNGKIHLGESHPRLPAVELDRARHLGVRREGGHRAALDLLRARAVGVRAERDALRGQRVLPAQAGRGGLHGPGPLPHGRRREPDRGRTVRRRHRGEGHRGGRGDPDHRARRDPR